MISPRGTVLRCPNCEADEPFGSRYCMKCGTDLSENGELFRRCPSCGRDVFRRVTLCPHCGNSIPLVQEQIPQSQYVSSGPRPRTLPNYYLVVLGVIVVALILALKFVPLKIDESSYVDSMTVQYSFSPVLATESKWFIVPIGYTVSGSYSMSSTASAETRIYFTSKSGGSYSVYQSEKTSGSFSFKAETPAVDNRYFFSVQNNGYSTITVSFNVEVSGMTTFF
ncbi:zinc ribbon domain-containing protein [Candidatus Bathyarchaeota archaeon]|nr:zinc ribbon domain-containing protein [Candidatus Bathyarchaeota archaeon]